MIPATRCKINLGPWRPRTLTGLMRKASLLESPGDRIDLISGKFLSTPYRSGTLGGGPAECEYLIINLEALDCFTFIDYVESLRSSESLAAFTERLRLVRYKRGRLDFLSRRHFFTDWVAYGNTSVADVTVTVGREHAVKVRKKLNERADGRVYIDGLKTTARIISHIPAASVDEAVLGRIETGDYIGIYSNQDGLDVSHVGIAVWKDDNLIFRHASSRKNLRKVVDQDFMKYVAATPGIVVLRPLKYPSP